MGQNSSKSSANNSLAYYNGRENGGHAKIAINGTRRSASYGQLQKTDKKSLRSSDRKKKTSKEAKLLSETKTLLEQQFERENGAHVKHVSNNNKQGNGRIIQNGDILYRNVMKDSASETEDPDNMAIKRQSLNGHYNVAKYERDHEETSSFIRNMEHVPDPDFDNFVRNGQDKFKRNGHSGERRSLNGHYGHGLNSDYDNVVINGLEVTDKNASQSFTGIGHAGDRRSLNGNSANVSRNFEDFVARLRLEAKANGHNDALTGENRIPDGQVNLYERVPGTDDYQVGWFLVLDLMI